MKEIKDWTINLNAGTITHSSGTEFTFERGEIINIDLKGVPTKKLRALTDEATLLYRKEKKNASMSFTSQSGKINTGNPNYRRTRLTLSKSG
jgi:hypothetical protein